MGAVAGRLRLRAYELNVILPSARRPDPSIVLLVSVCYPPSECGQVPNRPIQT